MEQEESVVDKDRLENLRFNHNVGVKTRFFKEFASLCAAANEKVLVFSQFLRPLCLIIDQLKLALKWTEDEEILYMYENRQSLIHIFNDANSQVEILLASTNACSVGIILVGASRVVLLDVEWNLSVERTGYKSSLYNLTEEGCVHIICSLNGLENVINIANISKSTGLSELIFSAKNANNNDESKSSAVNIEDIILDKMI